MEAPEGNEQLSSNINIDEIAKETEIQMVKEKIVCEEEKDDMDKTDNEGISSPEDAIDRYCNDELVLKEEGGANEDTIDSCDDIASKAVLENHKDFHQTDVNLWDDSEDEEGENSLDLGNPKEKILWASEKNEIEAVRELLADDPSLVNSTDNDLYTPLHRASSHNHIEVIKILLVGGASVSAKTLDGWEPLHCACKWDSIDAASLLLQNGSNVNALTKGALTPLHLAASSQGGRRTLELLLWHPYIDTSIKNEAGDTAYDTAARSGALVKLFELVDSAINVY